MCEIDIARHRLEQDPTLFHFWKQPLARVLENETGQGTIDEG